MYGWMVGWNKDMFGSVFKTTGAALKQHQVLISYSCFFLA